MNGRTLTTDVARVRRARRTLSAGDLDDDEWRRASPLPLTRYWSGEAAPAERHAEARMLWSDSGLLVRFMCRQDEPLIVNAHPRREAKTIGLWEQDVCEIFVAPNEEEPGRYLEFEVAPTGEWLDLAIRQTPQGRETDWDFHSGMSAAARVAEGHVVMALCVPWEAFGGAPEADNVMWRGNLFRCVGAGAARGYLAWRPTRTETPNFHAPGSFGRFLFSD